MSEKQLLQVLQIGAWLAFVNEAIIAGAQLTAIAVALYKPEYVPRVYGMDESWPRLLLENEWNFYILLSLAFWFNAAKAYAWYCVIQLFTKWKSGQPFRQTNTVAMKRIATAFVWVGMIGIASANYAGYMAKWYGTNKQLFAHSGEYLFIAGLVYLMAKVFAKGEMIEQENQLTV